MQEKCRTSLAWRIYQTNKRDIWINLVFGLISSIASFGIPYFLQRLLEYIEEKEGPRELAYLYVLGILVSDVVRSLTFGQNLYYGRRVDVRLRAMIGAEVYAKSLRRKDMTGIVAENTKKETRSDTGMIINLMAVDANRIAGLASSAFYLYTCPLEIFLACVMLYGILGLSAFVGLGVMLLTFPIHHFAGKKYAKIQEQMMETRDRRVGLMSELLQGIRMIKFFTWENNIRKKIMGRVNAIYEPTVWECDLFAHGD
jgi:ABC-type multidrug transport system fused ATPase/permease subunit